MRVMQSEDWQIQVSSAIDDVSCEIKIVRAERAAFEDFSHQLESHLSSRSGASIQGKSLLHRRTQTQDNPVLNTYRDTVMQLDHYDEDYGEPALENITRELGDGIAELICSSNGACAEIQSVIHHAVNAAIRQRKQYCEILTTEVESLQEWNRDIQSLHTTLTDLSTAVSQNTSPEAQWRYRDTVERHRTELDSKVAARQQQITDLKENFNFPNTRGGIHNMNIFVYLYDELPVTFPVLADLAALADQLDVINSQVEQAIISG